MLHHSRTTNAALDALSVKSASLQRQLHRHGKAIAYLAETLSERGLMDGAAVIALRDILQGTNETDNQEPD